MQTYVPLLPLKAQQVADERQQASNIGLLLKSSGLSYHKKETVPLAIAYRPLHPPP